MSDNWHDLTDASKAHPAAFEAKLHAPSGVFLVLLAFWPDRGDDYEYRWVLLAENWFQFVPGNPSLPKLDSELMNYSQYGAHR